MKLQIYDIFGKYAKSFFNMQIFNCLQIAIEVKLYGLALDVIGFLRVVGLR